MDTSFNTTNFLLCPECKHDIPLISLVPYEDGINIRMKCTCSKHDSTYTIKSFLKSTQTPPNNEFNNCSSQEHSQKGTMFCPDCLEWYCDECLKFHQKYRANHHLITYDIKVNCQIHKINYLYYCMSCIQSICRECYMNHQGHELVSITNIDIQGFKDELKGIEAILTQNNYYNMRFSAVTEAKIDSLQKQINQLNELKKHINNKYEQNRLMNDYLKQYTETLIDIAHYSTGRPNYQIMKNIKDIKINNANININEDNYKRLYFNLKNHYENNYILILGNPEKKSMGGNTKRRGSLNDANNNRRSAISKEPNNYLNEIESLIFADNEQSDWNISALPSKYQGKLPTLMKHDPKLFPDDIWESDDIAKTWITNITPNQYDYIESLITQLDQFDYQKLIKWKLGHLLKHLFNTLLSTKSTKNYIAQYFMGFISSININNTNEIIAQETLTFLANMMLFSLKFPCKFNYKDLISEEDSITLNLFILRLLNYDNIINNTNLLRYGVFICFCRVFLSPEIFDSIVRKIMIKNETRFHSEDLNAFCLIFIKPNGKIPSYHTYYKGYDDSCGSRWIANAILILFFHSHNYFEYTDNSDLNILSCSSLYQLITLFNSKKLIIKTDLFKKIEGILNQQPTFSNAIREILQNHISNLASKQMYSFSSKYLSNAYFLVSETYHSNENYRLIGYLKIDSDNINEILACCISYDDKNNKTILTSYGFNRKPTQQAIPHEYLENWIMTYSNSTSSSTMNKKKAMTKNATFYFYFNTNAGKDQHIVLPTIARIFEILGRSQKDLLYPMVYLEYFNSRQSMSQDQITAIVNIYVSMFNQAQLSIEFIEDIKDKFKHNAQDITLQLLKRLRGSTPKEKKDGKR